jgi:hypothetical protein
LPGIQTVKCENIYIVHHLKLEFHDISSEIFPEKPIKTQIPDLLSLMD